MESFPAIPNQSQAKYFTGGCCFKIIRKISTPEGVKTDYYRAANAG